MVAVAVAATTSIKKQTNDKTIFQIPFNDEKVHSTKSNSVAYETKYHLKRKNIYKHTWKDSKHLKKIMFVKIAQKLIKNLFLKKIFFVKMAPQSSRCSHSTLFFFGVVSAAIK